MCFDVVEGPSLGGDSERYSYDPALGLFRAGIAADGGIVVREEALRSLLAEGLTGQNLAEKLQGMLGTAWDESLEPLRQGADGGPVTFLSQVG